MEMIALPEVEETLKSWKKKKQKKKPKTRERKPKMPAKIKKDSKKTKYMRQKEKNGLIKSIRTNRNT